MEEPVLGRDWAWGQRARRRLDSGKGLSKSRNEGQVGWWTGWRLGRKGICKAEEFRRAAGELGGGGQVRSNRDKVGAHRGKEGPGRLLGTNHS